MAATIPWALATAAIAAAAIWITTQPMDMRGRRLPGMRRGNRGAVTVLLTCRLLFVASAASGPCRPSLPDRVRSGSGRLSHLGLDRSRYHG